MYSDYLNMMNTMNDFAVQINERDELRKFSLSDKRWVKNKYESLSESKVKKGEVYQFEFGKNFMPEIAYEHRGLVIGVNKKLLYVLPIFSYNSSLASHVTAYEPITNPNFNSDYYLLRASEFDFIKHDSVLKLNDMRSISINRKLYPHGGKLDIESDTYKNIEHLAIRKHFASFYFEFCKLKNDYGIMEEELKNMRVEKGELEKKLNECLEFQKTSDNNE
jgi:hypothetical protein